jgi:hypothetical protein
MQRAPDLDDEMARLAERLPPRAARFVRWLRRPESRRYRIPAAIVLIPGGLAGFLPLLGFWMIPLGLVLIAQDVPPLRGPMARLLARVRRGMERRSRGNAA